ncbi:zinc finger protein 99-like X1 [Biomphalaria pfeifferi]|uniref:Zinc finger protein 99-like X1 n=1 Tax=Biomphalaria pfeifferi TaxID=112525 RepID=A0AAD8BPM9_BIOPF|nr:zinc finger protein 99-like X1 [Biomphalaria pfeifferi]
MEATTRPYNDYQAWLQQSPKTASPILGKKTPKNATQQSQHNPNKGKNVMTTRRTVRNRNSRNLMVLRRNYQARCARQSAGMVVYVLYYYNILQRHKGID